MKAIRPMLHDGEFLTQLGSTNQGDFVRVTHVPSGKVRWIVGLGETSFRVYQARFMKEIREELRLSSDEEAR